MVCLDLHAMQVMVGCARDGVQIINVFRLTSFGYQNLPMLQKVMSELVSESKSLTVCLIWSEIEDCYDSVLKVDVPECLSRRFFLSRRAILTLQTVCIALLPANELKGHTATAIANLA